MNILNKNERIIIYMIGSFMGNKMVAWPSHDELARVCGMSIKTLQRSIKKLEEKNILFVERRHRQNNVYTFNPNWLAIFDELGVKVGNLGRHDVRFASQHDSSRASNGRTNIINNNINNKGVSEKYKKWEGLSPTAEKGSPLYEEMVKSRH